MVKRKSLVIPTKPCEIEVAMAARHKAGSATSTVPADKNAPKETVFKLKLKGEFKIAKKKDAEVEAIRKLQETNPEAAARAEAAMV